VDTSAADREIFSLEQEAQNLRAELKGFGEIDLTPVPVISMDELREQRAAIMSRHRDQLEVARDKIQWVRDLVALKARRQEMLDLMAKDIRDLEKKLETARHNHAELTQRMKEDPAVPSTGAEEAIIASQPATQEVDQKILEAAAQNERAVQYSRNLARAEQKKVRETKLSAAEKRVREVRGAKLAALKEINAGSKIPGLTFDENGEFLYQGTQASMLSTSQLMDLTARLSGLYPEGFGLELIDRGESLGRSIFDYIEVAKKRNATILSAIVGEKPASTPAEVGVFVVRDGKIFSDNPTPTHE
jgi:hypothetical protein